MNGYLRMAILPWLLAAVGLYAGSRGADPQKPEGDDKPRTDLLGDSLPRHALARFGTTRLRHHQSMASVAWSPDGKMIAAGGIYGSIRLWEATGKELELSFPPNDGSLLAFFGDAENLVTAHHSRDKLRVRNLDTGKGVSLPVPKDHGMDVQVLAGSPDGKLFAVAGSYAGIHVYETRSATLAWAKASPDHVDSLAFSADGKLLAMPGNQWGSILLRTADKGANVASLEGHTERLFSVAFAPDGKTLASSSLDKTVRFWDLETHKELKKIDFKAYSLAYSPDGKLLALACDQKEGVQLWDAARLEKVRTMTVPGRWDGERHVLAFSPDGKTLAVGGRAHHLYLFDVATGKDTLSRPGHQDTVVSVAFSPDGKTLASRGGDQTVRLWDLSTNKELRQWPVGDGPFFDQLNAQFPYPEKTLAFSPDGRLLAASAGPEYRGKYRGGVFLWDVASCRLREEFRGKPEGHFPVRFTPDGQALLVPTKDGPKLWSPETGKVLGQLTAKGRWVLAFSPDGRTAAGWDGKDVLLEDWRTGLQVSSFPAWKTTLNLLEFSPGGHLVAAAGIDDDGKGRITRGVRLHEAATGTLWRSLAAKGRPDSTGTVGCFAFSPDHRLFAAGFMPNYTSGPVDHSIRLWDLLTGKQVGELSGHSGPVRSVAFSPDGMTLASGSDDTTVLLWDVSEFREPLPAREGDRETVARLVGLLKTGDKEVTPYDAAWQLAGLGDKSVTGLKEVLSPVRVPEPKQFRQLIAGLDADAFATRTAASVELLKLGQGVEPALRELLKDPPSPQVGASVKTLLEKIAAEEAPRSRALLVLELIGSPAARDLLRKIAGGAEGARLTRDAQLALERLDRLAKDR